jgi:hypothetical protein
MSEQQETNEATQTPKNGPNIVNYRFRNSLLEDQEYFLHEQTFLFEF